MHSISFEIERSTPESPWNFCSSQNDSQNIRKIHLKFRSKQHFWDDPDQSLFPHKNFICNVIETIFSQFTATEIEFFYHLKHKTFPFEPQPRLNLLCNPNQSSASSDTFFASITWIWIHFAQKQSWKIFFLWIVSELNYFVNRVHAFPEKLFCAVVADDKPHATYFFRAKYICHLQPAASSWRKRFGE